MNPARYFALLAAATFVAACGHDSPGSGVGAIGNNAGMGAFGQPPGTPGAAGSVGATGGTGATPATAGSGTTATGAGRGATAAGNGATPTAGTSAGTAGTGTGMPAAGGGAPTSGGGYLVNGAWKGYAWTAATGMGSTIMPMNFAGLAAGAPLCVMGSVAATTDYSAVGMLGVNLNQAATMDAPLMTVTPTGSGLMVDIMNTTSAILRVQVQAPDGDMNAEHRWCAPVAGKGGLMPWTAFNTKCWDNSGTAYAKEPISSVIITVPGTTSAAVPFNFCLNNVGESADATGGTPTAGSSGGAAGSSGGTAGMPGSSGGGGPGMGAGMLSGNFDWHTVTRDSKEYIVQNNVWGGGGSQTVSYNGTSFEVTSHMGSSPTTGAPSSYPSVFIGSNNGHTTNGSGLPKQVSALGSVKTSWSHNGGPSIGGTYNAAYDVWFSTNAGGDSGAPSGGYLMVWLYKTANVQPLGNTIAQSGVTIPGVEGTWDVWVGQQMGKPCISYVRTSMLGSINYDLNAFIQDAVKRPEKAIQASWYLTNVFAGFEIWTGGMGLKTHEFSAVVQ